VGGEEGQVKWGMGMNGMKKRVVNGHLSFYLQFSYLGRQGSPKGTGQAESGRKEGSLPPSKAALSSKSANSVCSTVEGEDLVRWRAHRARENEREREPISWGTEKSCFNGFNSLVNVFLFSFFPALLGTDGRRSIDQPCERRTRARVCRPVCSPVCPPMSASWTLGHTTLQFANLDPTRGRERKGGGWVQSFGDRDVALVATGRISLPPVRCLVDGQSEQLRQRPMVTISATFYMLSVRPDQLPQ